MYQYLVDDEDDEIVAMQTKDKPTLSTIDNHVTVYHQTQKSSPLLKHK